MKFSDGNWLMQPGVKAHYASEAYDVRVDADSLSIFAPTHAIRHRGDTLGGPVLTVKLSSPLPDVIRVQTSHFTGGRELGPDFEIAEGETETKAIVTDETATLTSGKLTVKIPRKGGWKMDFVADGKTVTSTPPRSLGYMETDADGPFMASQLTLGVGENVYGLGERFTSFVKNGQVVDTWNKDGGTGSDQAYKNIPFYLTNRGVGVFVNHPENVSFEVASEKVSRVQFSVAGEHLDYFVIYGPTPKEILQKYTALTGRPALPPAWSFGLWLTTSFTTNYDEKTVTHFIQGMAERRLPLSVFHFDCFWMRGFHWCDFEWDPATFPDPPGMLARLHELDLKICVWINSYIAQASRLFDEGKAGGYLLKRKNSDVWQWDLWQPGMAIVDFTNPEACKWFASKLRALVNMGVDAFKTDFGERIPTEDVAWFDGSDPQKMHNYYTQLYNKVVFDVLEETRGAGEAVLFARSATAGGQQFPVHWGGDCNSNFESMAESLRGGLSLCLSGFGFWSHDIGGFEGTPPADVYKRWIAFGLLSSHSRLHGSSSYRVPWEFDDEAVDVLRKFTQLKCKLMPYLFAKAVEARETGVPVMRAMLLEFPDDPACDALDRQFMLGDSLLVAPVFSSDGVVDFYVPEGVWTDFLSGETFTGPRWFRQTHALDSLPLLVRPNTLLPIGNIDSRPDYDFADGVVFHAFQIDADAETTIFDASGEKILTARATRQNGKTRVTTDGGNGNWSAMENGETLETNA